MKVLFTQQLTKSLLACGLLVSLPPVAASAQTVASPNQTINETGTLNEPSANTIEVPAGANGVVINNAATGQIISGSDSAITTSADTEVNNSGLIDGAFNGVNFANGAGSGSLTNNAGGTINSASRGVNIGGSVALTNDGDIIGTGVQRNGTVYSDGVATDFSVNNSGTVDAGVEGSAFAAEIQTAGNTFSVDNSGTLQGRGTVVNADGVRVGNAGNSGTATVDITNTGTISSESTTGTTAGLRFVDNVGLDGTVENSGTISGAQNGVYFGDADHSAGEFTNEATGVVTSDSRAVNIDGIGLTVNNDGDILGTGTQRNGTVYSDGTATDFSFNNSGTVDAGVEGSAFAAEIQTAGNTFSVDNSGTLQGRGTVVNADGVRVGNAGNSGTATVDITNTGTISSESTTGTTAGLRFVNSVDFAGTLDNSGTISGTQNGLYFGTGDHSAGVANNSGTISSDSRAVNVDGTGLTVNNTGDILATGQQRNGTLYVDGTADNFEINNLGSIDASGGAGSGVSVQVGAIQSGNITNSGSITGFGNQSLDAGVRFFTDEVSAVFSGNITNEVGGVISGGDSSQAVLFGDNVDFNGSLFNDGLIDGGIDINSGTLALSGTSILSLDIASLTDFESVLAEGIQFDGTLDLNFVDGFIAQQDDAFDLFDFGPGLNDLAGFATGSFDNIFADGVTLDTSLLLSDGIISVAAVAVPEPSSLAILAFGAMGFNLRRRRS